jgi:phage I-like protein
MAIRRQYLFVDLMPVSDGEAKEAPTEFRLFKMGVNDSEKGPVLFDEQSAVSVMSEWKRRGLELTADYEHSTLLKARKGEKSPNSCKSFGLEVRADGLYAVGCKWTDEAKADIESGRYRYFSPYFHHDEDGRVTALINFGLTNTPALNGIAPLMAASLLTEDIDMDELEKAKARIAELDAEIAKLKTRGDREAIVALSVSAGLDPATDRTALNARVRELTEFRTAALSLAGASATTEAIGNFTAWKADASKAKEALSRMASMEEKALDDELEALMAKADKERKLSPAEAPTFRAIALSGGDKPTRQGLQTLTACIAAKAPVAALSATTPGTEERALGITIPAEVEGRFLRSMNIQDPKVYAEWSKTFAAANPGR